MPKNDQEILMEIADIHTGRYKNHQEYEDLWQECYLVLFDYYHNKGLNPARMHSIARKAVYKYLHFDLAPVYIPDTGPVRSIIAALKRDDLSFLDDTDGYTTLAAYYAISGEQEPIQDGSLGITVGDEDLIWDAMNSVLDQRECDVLWDIFYSNQSLAEGCSSYGLSPSGMAKVRDGALKKLHHVLHTEHTSKNLAKQW